MKFSNVRRGGNPPVSAQEVRGLKAFATTARQLEVLEAVELAGSASAGAARLGVSRELARNVIGKMRKRAAGSGYSPAHGWTKSVPEPMRLKGNSDLYDNGRLDKQWVKSERAPDGKPKVDPKPEGFATSKISTMYDRQGQVLIQHHTVEPDAHRKLDDLKAAVKEIAKAHRWISVPSKVLAKHLNRDLLAVYVFGDPHVGMLAWPRETGSRPFDLQIAQEQLRVCMEELVSLAPPAEEALIIDVGDFFHTDDDTQLTPRGGHKLDGDSRSGKVLRVGLALFCRLIELALQKHKLVRVDIRRGNHDPKLSMVLQMLLAERYRDNKRVVIEENLNPFAYYLFGTTLIGTCHGNETKPERLPGVMATDCGRNGIEGCQTYWGKAHYKWWVCGHVHHKKEVRVQEYPDVKVEFFNTLAPRDAWTNTAAFRSAQYLQVVSVDREFGERGRHTCDIRKVESLIEKARKKRKRGEKAVRRRR